MKKGMFIAGILASILLSSQVFAANTLVDVTQGEEIRGIVTGSSASGYAKVSWDDTNFKMQAGFEGLTDPAGDDFYEGWLVRKSPFAFISTGKLVKKDGKYHNDYSSDTNYSDYTQYVLTIEPNDGDDAPADHILEGMTTLVDSIEKKPKMLTMDDSRKEKIKMRVQERLGSLSPEQVILVLERITKFRAQLEDRNISDEKKAHYNEILDIFVEVLTSQ